MSLVAPGAYAGLAPIGAYAPGTPLHDLFVTSTTRLINNIGEACRNYSQAIDPLLNVLPRLLINKAISDLLATPYKPRKPNRKKQGREPGEKKRSNPNWKPRNPPKEPPRHTPSRKN